MGGLRVRPVWGRFAPKGISAFHVALPATYRHGLLCHRKTDEWFYVLRGQTRIVVRGRAKTLRPGSFAYMGPGVPHQVSAGRNGAEVLVLFSPPMNMNRPDVEPLEKPRRQQRR